MKVSELALQSGYDYSGKDVEINRVSYYDEASEEDLAVIFHRHEIQRTKAKAVLSGPLIIDTDKTIIMSWEDINTAMVRVCSILMENQDFSGKNRRERKQFIAEDAKVHPTAIVGEDVVIGERCVIGPYTVIGTGTVLGSDVRIGAGSRIGDDSFFHYGGDEDQLAHFCGCGQTRIGKGTHIGSNTVIQRGTISDTSVGEGCMIGNLIDIGHDVKIGNYCKIVSQTGIAGRAVIGSHVQIYGQAGIANHAVIGDYAVVKAKTLVNRTVRPYETVFGIFGRNYAEELQRAVRIRKYFAGKEMW